MIFNLCMLCEKAKAQIGKTCPNFSGFGFYQRRKTKRAEITVLSQDIDDYISPTDMARSQLQDVVIIEWLSLKSTIEYPGEWESLYNSELNYTEFGTIEKYMLT